MSSSRQRPPHITAWASSAPTTLLVLNLIATGANLRGAVSSVGPVLRAIQADLTMSDTIAGLLTTLPLICFGVVGLYSARIARRFDPATALVGCMVVLTIGLAARPFADHTVTLLLTTLVALTGIAVGNVLVPVAVKVWFPDDVGRMTGWYSMAISMGTAIPAALTVPMADLLGGWRGGLGFWVLPAILALAVWGLAGAVAASRRPDSGSGTHTSVSSPREPVEPGTWLVDSGAMSTNSPRRSAAEIAAAVRRHPKALALMLFFGLQSTGAYVAVGWLPSIFQDAGISEHQAGLLLAATWSVPAPISWLVPRLAVRLPDQRPLVLGSMLAWVGAYLGLLYAPAAVPWLWALLFGVGLGAFPLALVMIGLRATTSAGTSTLSSMTQGGGYLIAMAGPLGIGALHDMTQTWTAPLWVLLLLVIPTIVAGWVAASPGTVDD